jgi:hypothetical protein
LFFLPSVMSRIVVSAMSGSQNECGLRCVGATFHCRQQQLKLL